MPITTALTATWTAHEVWALTPTVRRERNTDTSAAVKACPGASPKLDARSVSAAKKDGQV